MAALNLQTGALIKIMSTSSTVHHVHSFAGFVLDVDRGALVRDGEDIKLRPKSFEMLRYMVERPGLLVSKNDILDAIWGNTVVTDDAVTQCLMDIRRAIGDRSQQLIRTVPRRGYIFDIPVTTSDDVVPAEEVAEAPSHFSNASRWRSVAIVAFVAAVSVAVWSFTHRQLAIPATDEATSSVASHSIAVLPFLDMSEAQDLRYFADGISEEVLNLLAQDPDLRVIARTSSFTFDGHEADIETIRDRLNVTHVLEGSVRRSDDTVRITTQLVDAITSEHIWSETYDRKLDDIFAVQEEISFEVLKRLTASLMSPTPRVHETDPEAYRLYLQALYMIEQLDFSKNAEAELIIRRALALDSEFAPAWRELSRILWRRIGDGPNPEEDIANTLDALERAIAIDPDDAATLAYLGWHYTDFYGDIDRGARLFEKALAIEPSNEHVIRTGALFAHAFGRPEDAVAISKFGVARNPLCLPCYVQLVTSYVRNGQLDEAESATDEIESVFNKRISSRGEILLLNNQPEEALAAFLEDPDEGYRLFGTALALDELGDEQKAQIALDEFVANVKDKPSWSWALAEAYARTNQLDAAFEILERAASINQLRVSDRLVRWNLQRISSSARSPYLEGLHDDPRWHEFLERYGISPETLAEVDFRVSLPD